MKKALIAVLMMLAGVAHSAEWLNTEVNIFINVSSVHAVDLASLVNKGNIRTAWTKHTINNSDILAYITVNCEKQMWRSTERIFFVNGVVTDDPGPRNGPWNFFDFSTKDGRNKFKVICQ